MLKVMVAVSRDRGTKQGGMRNWEKVHDERHRQPTPATTLTTDHTGTMAPSYENLPVEDDDFDESEIDFSDLQEQYEVRLGRASMPLLWWMACPSSPKRDGQN